MLETTARENQGQIPGRVRIRVAEATAVKHLRVIEQGATGLPGVRQPLQQVGKRAQLRLLDLAQLGDFLRLVAVVREPVRLALHAGYMWHDGEGAERECDHARAVGLQSEPHELEHELRLLDHLIGVSDVSGLGKIYLRLRPIFPRDAALKAAFEFAHTLKILVEPRAVLGRNGFLQTRGLAEHEVEHTAAGLDPAHRRGLLFWRTSDEQAAVKPPRTRLRRDAHARARHRERVAVVVAVFHREREGGEAVLQSDFLRGELIERKRIAERRLARMRRAGEETLTGVVVPIHARMRQPGDDGELRAVRREHIEIRTRWLARLRKEELRHHPERDMDRNEALGRQLFGRAAQQRQGEKRARGAEEMAAGDHFEAGG